MTKTKLSILFCLSIISLFVHGYQFSTGDQSVYVPQVLKLVDGNLYRRDYFVTHSPESRFSFFFPLTGTLLRLTRTDIQWFYFSFYLINHLLITYALYRLSLALTHNRPTAIVAVVLLSLPRFVAGTTITTLDTAWLPRFAALPLFLLTLNRLVINQFFLSLYLTILVGLIHPFSGLLLLSLTITSWVWHVYESRLV